MAISVEERDALRALINFIRDELTAAGDPDNSLAGLQALSEPLMAQYQAAVDTDEAVVWALINADATGQVHTFWADAQAAVWTRLEATLSAAQQATIFGSRDLRVKRLGKSLPKLASLRWTITNFTSG